MPPAVDWSVELDCVKLFDTLFEAKLKVDMDSIIFCLIVFNELSFVL